MERNDGNTAGKRKGEVQDDGERLTGSIALEAFCCRVCAQPLKPPIFQCPVGHFFCSSCHDKLPGNNCQFCSGCAALERSHGMERAVRSILVDCCYAEHGCTEKTAYCDKDEHEKACSHARCSCPEPGCGYAGRAPELLDHLTGHHKWPATTFRYRKEFDLRVDKPGTHVLHCEEDGQLFLVSVRPAAQPAGLAVALVCVPPFLAPTGFGCTVSFSSFRRHQSTSTVDDVRPLRLSDWPPVECICVLPKVASDGGNDDAGVVLTFTIVCATPESDDEYVDPYDASYIQSDEDETDSDSDSS